MKPGSRDFGPMSKVSEPVMQEFQRIDYDLSHWSNQVGAIGSLQTLSCMPVVAGDSFQATVSSVVRLSPLRRNMYLDAVVDMFAFYIPHRHIYSNWVDFIKAGFDESVTLGTDTSDAADTTNCLGLRVDNNTAAPRWLLRGYVQIWNRYFMDPSDASGEKSATYMSSLTSAEADFGLACCHMPTIGTATLNSDLAAADYQLALDAGTVNLQQFSQQQGRLKTEINRDWYAVRYNDILMYAWGSSANTDADQRPTLLMRTTRWLSGVDVNGTDDATLGTWAGKSAALCELSMPFKFFPEHGTLWFMMLVRFPRIHAYETHYLVTKPEPTYLQIAGDPELIRREPPVTLNLNEIQVDAGSVDLGKIPYAQWYRTHPSFVHQAYTTIEGHPFLSAQATTRNTNIYIAPTDYDGVFSSLQLKHWQAQTHLDIIARRFIPDSQKSIFAGANSVV